MANYSLIDCAEVHDTRTEEYDVDGQPRASVTLRCAASDAKALINDLIRNRYSRMWPHRDNMFPKSCRLRFEPGQYTQDGQSMDYEYALVEVTYGVDEEGGSSDGGGGGGSEWEVASEVIEPTTQFVTFDPVFFQWNQLTGADADPVKPGEEAGYQLKRMKLIRIARNIQYIPFALFQLMGTVNDRVWNSRYLGTSFPAETLLFAAPTFTRSLTNIGTQGWIVQLIYEVNWYGWNEFLRASASVTPGFYPIYTKSDLTQPYKPYPLMDHRPFLP
jgi:hypothetical protein